MFDHNMMLKNQLIAGGARRGKIERYIEIDLKQNGGARREKIERYTEMDLKTKCINTLPH